MNVLTLVNCTLLISSNMSSSVPNKVNVKCLLGEEINGNEKVLKAFVQSNKLLYNCIKLLPVLNGFLMKFNPHSNSSLFYV